MNNLINYFYFPGLRYSPDDLLHDICKIYSFYSKRIKNGYVVTPNLIKDKDRRMHVVEARMVFMYLIKSNAVDTLTLASIGAMVNRDHSTVLNAISEIKNRISVNCLLIPPGEFGKLSNKRVYDARMFVNVYEPERSTV